MYDFAIIGSGVSGARIAYELTVGGAKCVMIEAGRTFDRTTFPPHEMGYSTQMFWNGGLEISRDGRLGFLRGKCLGGTSVVNQADVDRFDDVAWDDWRDRAGIDFLRRSEMDPLYDDLQRQVAVTRIDEKYQNANAKLFVKAFEALGYDWKPIDRSQTDCALEHGSDCIVCLGGCPRDSKQSAIVKIIPEAKRLGLVIETLFEVEQVEDQAEQVVIRGTREGQRREITAQRAVLAAGSFGNTALLFRSGFDRDLPALGRHFSCHPQFMTYGVFDERIDAHKGALQSVQAHDGKLRSAGLKLENVYAPPIATAMLLPGVRGRHQAAMKKYRHFAVVEVAIRDEAAGRLRVDRKNRLVIEKKLTAVDREKIREGTQLAGNLLTTVGAREVIDCHQAFGLHLMGGCSLGTDARGSVVNPDFQLHGHPRLYTADSSIFPAAPGINPSFTIMALSLKAARRLLKN